MRSTTRNLTVVVGVAVLAAGCSAGSPVIEVEVAGTDRGEDAEKVAEEAEGACDIGWLGIFASEPSAAHVTIVGPDWENDVTVDCDTGEVSEREE